MIQRHIKSLLVTAIRGMLAVSAVYGLLTALGLGAASADEGLCARVKIEIMQELAFERQGFDARMAISNTMQSTALDNVGISVWFRDENGPVVSSTSDPNDSSALFFIRIDDMKGINDVSGSGTVSAATDAEIHWLIVPAAGAAGSLALGKRYFVGAQLTYSMGGNAQTIDVAPDFITVQPQPQLRLDYFLPSDVRGDDPFSTQIEPPEPYTLGVRVANNGYATARNVRIESAQPKIVENKLGLLIGFQILQSYLNDAPAQPSLLINFGDIGPSSAKVGRWIMESSLSGRFIEFTATFTHSDALGGQLTSLLTGAGAHQLIRDVLVDLPGRDGVRDFLARDGAAISVYESDLIDSLVYDQSASSTLSFQSSVGKVSTYSLRTPPTAGMLYVRLPDPLLGMKNVQRAVRSDGKVLPENNVWFSQEGQGSNTKYYFNLFDANGGGQYSIDVQDTPVHAGPVIQFIPNRTLREGQRITFLIQATDASGLVPAVSVDSTPAGASFIDQGKGTGVFDWPTKRGQAGKFPLTFRATDGAGTASQSTMVTVKAFDDTSTDDGSDPGYPAIGPSEPVIISPLNGREVATLRPAITVQNSHDASEVPSYQFEIYADAAMTKLVQSASNVPQGAVTTSWTCSQDLVEDSFYYVRARAVGQSASSTWAYSSFFVNTVNEAPGPFDLVTPKDGAVVNGHTAFLTVSNSVDSDRDALYYSFEVSLDGTEDNLIDAVSGVAANSSGQTSWVAEGPFKTGNTYYWRAAATDEHGLTTYTKWTTFSATGADNPPTSPRPVSPVGGGKVKAFDVQLVAAEAEDPDNDALTYDIEVDTVSTFDSPNKLSFTALVSGVDGEVSAIASGLHEDTSYYWRVRAYDGIMYSEWAQASFFVNVQNHAPSVPTVKNPGNGSWVSTLTPALELNPSTDVDLDQITYRFEVYNDPALTKLVISGQSAQPKWTVSTPLVDHQTYYFRGEALDEHGLASNTWSSGAKFLVDLSAGHAAPVMTFTSVRPVQVILSGGVTNLSWICANAEPTATITVTANGKALATNLAASQYCPGSYTWQLTGVDAGDYQVCGSIQDSFYNVTAIGCYTLHIDAKPLDSDGDTLPDASDNCPYTSNVSQIDRGGLIVKTKDAVGDACQCGDLDGNGVVNASDVTYFSKALKKKPTVKIKNLHLCDMGPTRACDKTAYSWLNNIVTQETKNRKNKKKYNPKTTQLLMTMLQTCSAGRR